MSPELEAPARPATTADRARWPLLLGVAAVALVADQLTKWWALETLPGDPIDVVWTLQFDLAFNDGSAFSLAQGYGAILSVVALVIVGVLLRSGRYATRPLPAIAIGLVVGGALGNLADRAFRAGDGFLGGAVVDFIDLNWWPVFNVADSAIVVGAILLFLTQMRDDRPPPVDESAPPDEQASSGERASADEPASSGRSASSGDRP